jgi:hypothetical protein
MDESRSMDVRMDVAWVPSGHGLVHFFLRGLPCERPGELRHPGQATALDPPQAEAFANENLLHITPRFWRIQTVNHRCNGAGRIRNEAAENLGTPQSTFHPERLDEQDSHAALAP